MGLKDFFKLKKKSEESVKKELEIPPAPLSKEELPAFPSLEEVQVKKSKKFPSILEKEESIAVKKQEEELGEREELKLRKPIFVSLESYKEMVNEIGIVQNKLKEATDSLARVSEFKEDEDKEFNKWDSQLKESQRKLIFVDKALFRG